MCKLRKGENKMYPWEKDIFDLYDEAMERAYELAWADDESDEEDDEE